jgi:TP901 family phage tail tape measure protein
VNRTVLVTLAANVAGYQAAMASAAASTKAFASSAAAQTAAVGKGVGQMGSQAGMLGSTFVTPTLAAGAALVGVTKAAIDWESAWTGVRKTVDGSPQEMAALEDELRGLAKTLPATHGEIAAVAEAAGQLGIRREDIVGFTRTMIDLGETTNLTSDQAATAFARFANIMGTSTSEMDRLGSATVELGNNFATTEAEIVEMSTRIASAGVAIGLSEGDVLGLATALSSVGIEAEAGGTAISRVLLDMGKAVDTGSAKLETFAQVAGMSADAFTGLFREDSGAATAAFIEGLGDIVKSGESVVPVLEQLGFTDVRVGNALRSAAASSDLFTTALETGNRAYAENTAMAEEAALRYETTASRIAVAFNQVKDAAIDVGVPLAEVLGEGASLFSEYSRWADDYHASQMRAMGITSESANVFHVFNSMIDRIIPGYQANILGLEGVTDATSGMATSAVDAQAAVDRLGFASQYAGQVQHRFASEVAASGEQARLTAGEVGVLSKALRGLNAAGIAAKDAQIGWAQALDDASKSLDANGRTLKLSTESGRQNRRSLLEMAKAANTLSVAILEETGSEARMRASMQRSRGELVAMAQRFGMTRGEARRYADQVLAIPEKARTDVQLSGAGSATTAARNVRDAVNSIPTSRTIVIRTDTRNLRLPNPAGMADGGLVSGPGGPRDDRVPAWLSNGEFVVNAQSTRLFRPMLEAINDGRFARATVPASAGKPGAAGAGSSWTFNVNGTSDEVVDRLHRRVQWARLVEDRGW